MKFTRHLIPFVTLVLSISLCAAVSAAGGVTVESFVWASDSQIFTTFSDGEPGELGDYAVQISSDLQDGGWSRFGDATLASNPDGTWQATIAVGPELKRAFFRIVKNGSPVTAAFSRSAAELSEGDSDSGVLVQFSAPFTGTLHYSLVPSDGGEAQLGTLEVSGASSAVIPVSIADDAAVNLLEAIRLHLSISGSGNASYQLGATTSTTITIQDNDALWGGVLDFDDSSINLTFRLQTLTQGAGTEAKLITDAGSYFPPSGAADGSWPIDDTVLSASAFSGTVSIISDSTDSLYVTEAETDVQTVRSISFQAQDTAEDPEAVTPMRIRGTFAIFTEASGSASHVSFPAQTGTFYLFRQTPGVPESVKPVTPAP